MRLVEVCWLDAAGGERQGWRTLESMKAMLTHECRSVGFLLHKTDQVVILVPHVTGDQGDGEIVIPAPWVASIIDLNVKQPRVVAHESENDE